jgi:hypothetical protein
LELVEKRSTIFSAFCVIQHLKKIRKQQKTSFKCQTIPVTAANIKARFFIDGFLSLSYFKCQASRILKRIENLK